MSGCEAKGEMQESPLSVDACLRRHKLINNDTVLRLSLLCAFRSHGSNSQHFTVMKHTYHKHAGAFREEVSDGIGERGIPCW